MQLVPGHSCKARSPGNRTAGVTEDACLARGGRQAEDRALDGGDINSYRDHTIIQSLS